MRNERHYKPSCRPHQPAVAARLEALAQSGYTKAHHKLGQDKTHESTLRHVMQLSYLNRFSYEPGFPTVKHCAAAEAVVDYWAADPWAQAVLLTCSCARGRASVESCVDIAILVPPQQHGEIMAHGWPKFEAFLASDPSCVALSDSVPWSGIDVDLVIGEFTPGYHGYTSGADNYEIEIGNTLAWVHPMLLNGPRFEQLQQSYLPYYAEALRKERLALVTAFARNNIDHIVPYARRGLYLQALKRLTHAFEEYLQALFISRRIYPLAYDKWVREQVVEVLGEPELFEELLYVLSIPSFTAHEFRDRAARMGRLLDALPDAAIQPKAVH